MSTLDSVSVRLTLFSCSASDSLVTQSLLSYTAPRRAEEEQAELSGFVLDRAR